MLNSTRYEINGFMSITAIITEIDGSDSEILLIDHMVLMVILTDLSAREYYKA